MNARDAEVARLLENVRQGTAETLRLQKAARAEYNRAMDASLKPRLDAVMAAFESPMRLYREDIAEAVGVSWQRLYAIRNHRKRNWPNP